MKLFENNKEQQELLNRISSLCGIKRSSVKSVWEYTIYCIFLQLMENNDAPWNIIPVPYLGKILIRESSENKGEFDTFIALDESIKEQIKKIKKGDMRDLISYFDKNFIDATINNLN